MKTHLRPLLCIHRCLITDFRKRLSLPHFVSMRLAKKFNSLNEENGDQIKHPLDLLPRCLLPTLKISTARKPGESTDSHMFAIGFFYHYRIRLFRPWSVITTILLPNRVALLPSIRRLLEIINRWKPWSGSYFFRVFFLRQKELNPSTSSFVETGYQSN